MQHREISAKPARTAGGLLRWHACRRAAQIRHPTALCSRPTCVCLCPALPPCRLGLTGRVVVLQHPHEAKKPLATVPLLERCLERVTVYRCRRYRVRGGDKSSRGVEARARLLLLAIAVLAYTGSWHAMPRDQRVVFPPPRMQPGSQSALRQALEEAQAGLCPLFVLFPGRGAADLRQAAAVLRDAGRAGPQQAEPPSGCACEQQQQRRQGGAPDGSSSASSSAGGQQERQQQQRQQQQQRPPAYSLLVLDGTWQQAKEMFNLMASQGLVQARGRDPRWR